MTRPTTAREALIAEALSDMAQLVDRIEALAPAIDGARRALAQASADLARQADAFEARMNALTEGAKRKTLEHIVRRTNEVARQSLDAQSRAMADAAQALFRSELQPALQRLAMPLQGLMAKLDRPWQTLLMHAATAASASALTAAAVLYFLGP